MANACHHRTWDVEARGSGVQSQAQLHSKLKGCWNVTRPCPSLKKKRQQWQTVSKWYTKSQLISHNPSSLSRALTQTCSLAILQISVNFCNCQLPAHSPWSLDIVETLGDTSWISIFPIITCSSVSNPTLILVPEKLFKNWQTLGIKVLFSPTESCINYDWYVEWKSKLLR